MSLKYFLQTLQTHCRDSMHTHYQTRNQATKQRLLRYLTAKRNTKSEQLTDNKESA